MRLAVSNIAWHADEDSEVHRLLRESGIDAIEIAPTRLWADPAAATEAEARAAAARLADEGLETVSFQSLLFARPDLTVFGDEATRRGLVDYLERIARLAGWMGARRLVFGSPKARFVPPELSAAAAFDIATAFFHSAGAAAADEGTVLCIEPNPPAYGCNFVTTAAEGIALVEAVDSPGFGLHLDVAGLTLAGDDPAAAARAAGALVRHAHASAPQLGELENAVVDHAAFAEALREASYDGLVAIEMRSADAGLNAARVESALRVAAVYAG